MQIIYSTDTNFALDFERRKMVDLAVKLGLDDERVIEQSEKLDALIVEAQKRKVD